MKTINLVLAVVLILTLLIVPVMAQEDGMENTYSDFIWNNNSVMYAIDFGIIILAVLAIYFGMQMVAGNLKGAFIYVFAGVVLVALNYVLDVFAMLTNNMPLMVFLHHNIFWILNAIAFILITFGFYKMNKLFKEVSNK